MKSYLASRGLGLLQVALATLPDPPSLRFSGSQVGTATGFVPDDTMSVAQGTKAIDKSGDLRSVKVTPVNEHEIIVTNVIDRDTFDYAALGNVLFLLNNTPLLWLVADTPFRKGAIDPVAHFAGDKIYLSIVFRFPYIRDLIAVDPYQDLNAKFPVFATTPDLTIPQHTPADQVVVEANTLFYGHGNPFFAARSFESWWGNPLLRPCDDNFYMIDGGSTLAG